MWKRINLLKFLYSCLLYFEWDLELELGIRRVTITQRISFFSLCSFHTFIQRYFNTESLATMVCRKPPTVYLIALSASSLHSRVIEFSPKVGRQVGVSQKKIRGNVVFLPSCGLRLFMGLRCEILHSHLWFYPDAVDKVCCHEIRVSSARCFVDAMSAITSSYAWLHDVVLRVKIDCVLVVMCI